MLEEHGYCYFPHMPYDETAFPRVRLKKRKEAASHTAAFFDYSCSFRAFFRLRLRAKASLTRFFSPGFK